MVKISFLVDQLSSTLRWYITIDNALVASTSILMPGATEYAAVLNRYSHLRS